MLLRQIGKSNDDDGCEQFGNGRVEMHVLNQYVQNDIIKEKIDGHHQSVAKKLNAAFQVGAVKYNIF